MREVWPIRRAYTCSQCSKVWYVLTRGRNRGKQLETGFPEGTRFHRTVNGGSRLCKTCQHLEFVAAVRAQAQGVNIETVKREGSEIWLYGDGTLAGQWDRHIQLARKMRAHACVICNISIEVNPGRLTCSPACRQRLYRINKTLSDGNESYLLKLLDRGKVSGFTRRDTPRIRDVFRTN